MNAYEVNKERLRSLLRALEDCPPEQGKALLDGFVKDYDASLYQEVGRLARQLHDSLTTMQDEERLLDLTRTDIPDAKDRLRYVVSMTERTTQNVLSIVERSVPLSRAIGHKAEELHRRCLAERDVEDPELLQTVCGFLGEARDDAGRLHGHLNEIMMAQEYQDITGQIIKKVVGLVQEVEESLLKMITMTGHRRGGETVKAAAGVQGPHVPGVDEAADRVTGQDDVDQLLVSLGF
jgi:chemotaxis protein CheZ